MDESGRADVRQRLTEVEERLDRIAARFTFGYGSESDRDGWLLWIRDLTAQRDALRERLGDDLRDGDGAASLSTAGEPRTRG